MARASYPPGWEPVLMHHFLLRHAERQADRVAVVGPTEAWTYGELAARAEGYAATLDAAGVVASDAVVVQLSPRPEAIATIAALSMLGAVYVPLGMDVPDGRAAQVMEATGAKARIADAPSDQGTLLNAGFSERGLVVSGQLRPAARGRPGPGLESDVAYIIFTSGTTGRPKGIMISHRAALVFWRALVAHCGLSPDDRVGTFAPLSFDFSLIDMGAALGSGSTLIQMPTMLLHQPRRFVKRLADQAVTQMNCVPSVWRVLLRYTADEVARLEWLHTAFVAGEAFPITDVRRLREALPDIRIINCFGHTESMCCTFADAPNPLPPDMTNLPIGYAHPGAELLLLDDDQTEITEPGVVGELYLRGANLFSGYFRAPEATARALVPHPLRPEYGEFVFRTGDIAYKGPGGELYYNGRRDLQVQIMGMRTEVEEIERVLLEHEDLQAAAVLAVDGADAPMLVAFVAPAEGAQPPSAVELRARCGDRLPAYMVPTLVDAVDELPTTPNGKIDRDALRKRCAEKTAMQAETVGEPG